MALASLNKTNLDKKLKQSLSIFVVKYHCVINIIVYYRIPCVGLQLDSHSRMHSPSVSGYS